MKLNLLIIGFLLLFNKVFSGNPGNGFIENKGQIAQREINKLRPDVKFKLESDGINSYFKLDGIENYLYKHVEVPFEKMPESFKKKKELGQESQKMFDVYYFRFDINFIKPNKNVTIESQNEKEVKRNFYYEFCPNGILGVKEFEKITYKNLYDNIDLEYYYKDGHLKYDFILHKNANPSDIQIEYNGVKNLHLSPTGMLLYAVDGKQMEEQSPFTFVSSTGKELDIKYVINNNVVSFSGFNSLINEDITIDPVLEWSTYFPGVYGGYQGDPCVDASGNIYISCQELSGGTFPVLNAGSGQWYQGTTSGPSPNPDIVIFKFNSDYSLAWATYYGGQDYDNAWGKRNVAFDEVNQTLYVSGKTEHVYSNGIQNFPTMNPGGGAFYQPAPLYGNSCPFFLKFTSAGVRQWATLFNYEVGLPATQSMGIDMQSIYFRNGKLYFAGQTNKYSTSGIPLRTLAGAYNNSYFPGALSPFIGRFSTSGVLEWCSYLNANIATTTFFGNVADMVVDASNNLFIVTDYMEYSAAKLNTILPLVNPGSGAYYQATAGLGFGSRRGTHITKLNPTSSSIIWGTFYCGGYGDLPSACDLDQSNNLLVAWRSAQSNDFPCFNPGGGAYYQSTRRSVSTTAPGDYYNGGCDGAIAKFSNIGVRNWATYINGTTPTSSETGFYDVDCYLNGDIILSGKTVTSDYPLVNVPGSYNKSSLTTAGTYEGLFSKFSSGGVMQWSTYFPNVGNYGAIQNTSCSQKYIVDGGGGSTSPLVNPSSVAYYNTTVSNYQSFQTFIDPNAGFNSTAATSINSNPSSLCVGNTVTLTVVGGSLASGASWHWYTGGCGTTAVATGSSITVSPSSTTTYYVRAEGTCNTTGCTTLALTVNPTPTISLGSVSASTICNGANSIITPSGGSTYTLMPGSLTGTSFNVSPSTTTTYTISGTNASGCISNSSTNLTTLITVNPIPTIGLGSVSASTICSGANTIITPSGSSSYTLMPGSLTGTSFNVSPTTTTTYTISGTNASGCISNSSTNLTTLITVNPTPTISLGSVSASTICSGANATITPIGASSYTLMPGSLTGTSFIVNPTTTTIYTISGTASNGCTSTLTSQVLTTTISVQSSFIVSSVSPSSSTICLGSSVVITPTGFGPVASFTLLPTGLSSTGSFTVSPTTTTTYTIRAVSTLGCVNTSSPGISVVNVIPTPTISLGSVSASTICSGANSIITPTGGSTYTLTPGSITGTSFTVSPTTTTTYTINGTNASGCVSNTSTDLNTLITVNPTPIVSAGPSRTLTCVTTNTTLSGSGGGTYSWSGSGIVSGGTTSSPTINQPGTYSVLVTVSGCTNTANVVVSQNTVAPNGVSAGPNQTVTCGAPSVTLTGSYSSPAGCTANWLGGVSGSSTSFTTTASSAGIYTLVATNPANGCSSSSTVQVSPSAGFPTATVAPVTNSITCTNTLVPISITSTSTPISILWLGPSITGSSTTAATTVSAGGTYTVVVTNTLSLCSTSLTVIVPTNTLAVIGTSSIAPTTSLTCNVTSLVLNASPTGTMYAYNWTGPGIVSGASSASPTINVGGNYIVTITNTITGCSGTTGTRTITVSTNTTPPTGVSAGPNQIITCSAPSVTLAGSYTSPIGTTATWLGGVSGSSTSFTTTASSAGTFTLVGTNPATGCSSTSTVMVTPSAGFPSAIANAVTNSITCTNTLVPISITSTSTPISILWTGPSIIGSTTSASTTASAGGTYTVVVTNTVSLCSTSLTVIVPTNTTSPSVSISPSQSLTCGSPSVTISTTVSPSTDNTYSWSGPGILGGTTSSSIGANAAGNYSVTVTNTLTGCTAIASTSVQSNSALPTLSVTSSSSVITCLAPTVTLTASSSSTSSIIWATSTGTLSNPVNAVVAGIYTVSITDGISGCTNTQTVSVSGTTVAPMPTVAASVAIPCGASSTTLLATSTLTSGVSYTWFGPSVTSGSNTANPTVDQMGTYTVVLTDIVTGCSSTSTVDVTQGNVVAAFSADQSTGFAPLTVNFTDASVGATSYNWSFGNGSTSSTQNPNTVYANSGTYTVMLIASSGPCSDTAYTTITVEDELYIPELFSPNGDNFNDKFEIKGIAKYPNNKITIYNRWGNKVYEKEKYNNDWDGKPNVTTGTGSNSLAAGTYYVVFDKGNDEKPYTGYVQIEY